MLCNIMQALIEHSTVAGPHRRFLIDTETPARLPNEYDPVQLCRIPWRVIELCCVDLTTGAPFLYICYAPSGHANQKHLTRL